MITLAQIAKAAGVSLATISRVINGQPGVSEELAARVRKVMSDMGYQPKPMAKRSVPRPVTGKLESDATVAVIVLDDMYRYTPGVFLAHLKGIEDGVKEYSLNLTILHAYDFQTVQAALRSLKIAGVIAMGFAGNPEVVAFVQRYPFIWLSSHQGSDADAVLPGNYRIGCLAAEYLAGRGHKNVGYLSVMGRYPAYPTRAEAFEFAFHRAGGTAKTFISPVPENFYERTDPDMSQFRTALDSLVEQMLTVQPRITGLFVPNDLMTSVVYASLYRRGVIPGKDIDIVSCNNEHSCLLGLRPRPATIDIGSETMGRRCVQMLVWNIRHPQEQRPVQIAVEPVLLPADEW